MSVSWKQLLLRTLENSLMVIWQNHLLELLALVSTEATSKEKGLQLCRVASRRATHQLQIESLELEMDVELVNHEDEMLVNFPQTRRNFLNRENAGQAAKANAKIKLHVTAGPRPPGVDIVMQGYERSLKAQIP